MSMTRPLSSQLIFASLPVSRPLIRTAPRVTRSIHGLREAHADGLVAVDLGAAIRGPAAHDLRLGGDLDLEGDRPGDRAHRRRWRPSPPAGTRMSGPGPSGAVGVQVKRSAPPSPGSAEAVIVPSTGGSTLNALTTAAVSTGALKRIAISVSGCAALPVARVAAICAAGRSRVKKMTRSGAVRAVPVGVDGRGPDGDRVELARRPRATGMDLQGLAAVRPGRLGRRRPAGSTSRPRPRRGPWRC